MKRAAVILACMVFYCLFVSSATGQATSGIVTQPVSICTILSDAAKYDGEEVLVKGQYRMVIHGAILMGHSCSGTDVNLREAKVYKANKQASSTLRSQTKKDQFRPVDVVFRGIFHVAHNGQCFGQICAAYEIETTELLSADPVGSN